MKKVLAIGASLLAGICVILAGAALYQKNKSYESRFILTKQEMV